MRSTFMMSENETLIGLKARNSEYSNMSRLLFETVELYGTSVYNSKVNVFYHNISHHIFAAFVLYLSAPTSTTATFQVTKTLLHNSNISDGLILELVKQNNYSSIKCFDVRWISSHNNEDERLFIGSNRPLQIRSICSPVIRLLSGDDHIPWRENKFTKESIDSPTPDGKTYHLTNLPKLPSLSLHSIQSLQYSRTEDVHKSKYFVQFLKNSTNKSDTEFIIKPIEEYVNFKKKNI
eukprot:215693_1